MRIQIYKHQKKSRIQPSLETTNFDDTNLSMPKFLQPLTNTNLRSIIQVYQYNYINNKSPGLGDFLRGCFFLMQLARILNVDFKIDISNHPISEFIINNGKNNDINYNKVEFLIGVNRPNNVSFSTIPLNNTYIDIDFTNKIINELNKSNVKNFGIFTNAFPMFYHFSGYGRNYIKQQLMPNGIMVNYIKEAFDNLNLQPNTYGVIHIRTGDEYLSTQRNCLSPFTDDIIKIINKINNSYKKYLIISDNTKLKLLLKKKPNFYVYIHDIEHLGGEVNNNKSINGIKNTLLEFYLMSYSNSILSLSVYDHISGFSKYCSEIYNIPFKNIKIHDNKNNLKINMIL